MDIEFCIAGFTGRSSSEGIGIEVEHPAAHTLRIKRKRFILEMERK